LKEDIKTRQTKPNQNKKVKNAEVITNMRNSPPSLTLSLQPSQPVDIEPPHALVPFPHALLHPHRRKFSGALGEEKKQRCARKE